MKAVRDFIYSIMLRSLPHRYKQRLLINLAEYFNVSRMRIRGQDGEISGLITDDVIFRVYILDGTWSSNINELLTSFFLQAESGTFIDVGANIGLTTIPVAKNELVVCHAFEPEPVNFELLLENVKHNVPGDNIHLHNVALFSETMQLTFELAQANSGDHRVRYGQPKTSSKHFHERDRRTIVVPGRRLDEVLSVSALKKPIAAKIDTQGCEYHVYKGGRHIFREVSLLVLEYWPYGINRMDGNIHELLSMLREDFPYARLLKDHEPFSYSDLATFEEIAGTLDSLARRADEMEWRDLILTKEKAGVHFGKGHDRLP